MIRRLLFALLLNILLSSLALASIIALGFFNLGALGGMLVACVLLLPAQYSFVRQRWGTIGQSV